MNNKEIIMRINQMLDNSGSQLPQAKALVNLGFSDKLGIRKLKSYKPSNKE